MSTKKSSTFAEDFGLAYSTLVDFPPSFVIKDELELPTNGNECGWFEVVAQDDLLAFCIYPNLVATLCVAAERKAVVLADFNLLLVGEGEGDGVDCVRHTRWGFRTAR